jgi:hypothetical protein
MLGRLIQHDIYHYRADRISIFYLKGRFVPLKKLKEFPTVPALWDGKDWIPGQARNDMQGIGGVFQPRRRAAPPANFRTRRVARWLRH